MKIVYVNYGWRNEYGSDPRSYEHYLVVMKIKPEKIQAPTIPVGALPTAQQANFESLFATNIITSC